MALLDNVLSTIMRGVDPTTGTTTYTNVASGDSGGLDVAHLADVANTGIPTQPRYQPAASGVSSQSPNSPAPVATVAQTNLPPEPAKVPKAMDIIDAFTAINAEGDESIRERKKMETMMRIGEFEANVTSHAATKAMEMAGVFTLKDQLNAAEVADKQDPMYQRFKADSPQTSDIRARLLQAQSHADAFALKIVAEDPELLGIKGAAKVFFADDKGGNQKLKEQARLAQAVRALMIESGADSRRVNSATDMEVLANEKAVKTALERFTTGKIGRGPYSAFRQYEELGMPQSPMLQSATRKWVDAYGNITPMEQSSNPKLNTDKEREDFLDTKLLAQARIDFAGDHDNSLLTRLPAVGILAQIPEIAKTRLFQHIAAADPSARYSMKQAIGFAIKNDGERLKVDGAARQKFLDEIGIVAMATLLHTRGMNMKFGLPVEEQRGYRIAPMELLDTATNKERAALAHRYFDLTNAGDRQIFGNLLFKPYRLGFGGEPNMQLFGSSLRAQDTISSPPKPIR